MDKQKKDPNKKFPIDSPPTDNKDNILDFNGIPTNNPVPDIVKGITEGIDLNADLSSDNNNNNNVVITKENIATTPPSTTKVTAPFSIANMIKTRAELINLRHYLAFGKPLFDGSQTLSSYFYGNGESRGWIFSRPKFEGFKPEYSFPLRFELANEAEDAIMAIDLNTFNNQPARDKLDKQLKDIFARTTGNRYVQYMKEWMDGYHNVYQVDNKAKEWVEINQQMLSKALTDVKVETDLLNDAVDIQELLAFNIRTEKNKFPSTIDDKISAYIRGDLRSNILDTYLHHNINPKFDSQLSFDGKHNTQTAMPQPNDYVLSYITYRSHEILRKPKTLDIISHLFISQNIHHMINLQANKPQTSVETDLQSMLIKAMLLHRNPTLLLAQIKKGLTFVFENTEDRRNYNLHLTEFASDSKLFDSLRLAKVPKKLIDALNFLLGNFDLNDCKNSDQAIQAILESSANISKDLKKMMDDNKPKLFDKGLATEFLDNIAAFTQNPMVIHAMNTWLNPEYKAPTPEELKKNANTLTQTMKVAI